MNFDIPGTTAAETLPSLDNVVFVIPEPGSLVLLAVGLTGLGLASRKSDNIRGS